MNNMIEYTSQDLTSLLYHVATTKDIVIGALLAHSKSNTILTLGISHGIDSMLK